MLASKTIVKSNERQKVTTAGPKVASLGQAILTETVMAEESSLAARRS